MVNKIFKKFTGLKEEKITAFKVKKEDENKAGENWWFNKEETNWPSNEFEEGQLSVDIYQTPTKLIIKSTIAGVKPEDIKISLHNDLLTIKGKRIMENEVKEEDYFFRECYWGSFSRSVILPVEVNAYKIEADLEDGILTIILPKAKKVHEIMVKNNNKKAKLLN